MTREFLIFFCDWFKSMNVDSDYCRISMIRILSTTKPHVVVSNFVSNTAKMQFFPCFFLGFCSDLRLSCYILVFFIAITNNLLSKVQRLDNEVPRDTLDIR